MTSAAGAASVVPVFSHTRIHYSPSAHPPGAFSYQGADHGELLFTYGYPAARPRWRFDRTRTAHTEPFECKGDESDLYFFSHDGAFNLISIAADTLRAAIDDPAAQGTTALAQILDQYAEAILNDGEIEIDASGGWWDAILQDVVRRSATLDHLSVITAFTCDKMRPDGFGGMATLITAQAIRGQSTYELIAEFIADAVDEGEMKPLA